MPKRTHFDQILCPIAQAAEVVGDPWVLMILREAFAGVTRFGDFERELGIPKSTLTERLEHLIRHGVLEKKPLPPRGRRSEYVLTPKGVGLLTVTFALRDWSNQWVYGEGNEPLVVIDRRTGERVPPVAIRDAEGEEIPLFELQAQPGPGADEALVERLAGTSDEHH